MWQKTIDLVAPWLGTIARILQSGPAHEMREFIDACDATDGWDNYAMNNDENQGKEQMQKSRERVAGGQEQLTAKANAKAKALAKAKGSEPLEHDKKRAAETTERYRRRKEGADAGAEGEGEEELSPESAWTTAIDKTGQEEVLSGGTKQEITQVMQKQLDEKMTDLPKQTSEQHREELRQAKAARDIEYEEWEGVDPEDIAEGLGDEDCADYWGERLCDISWWSSAGEEGGAESAPDLPVTTDASIGPREEAVLEVLAESRKRRKQREACKHYSHETWCSVG